MKNLTSSQTLNRADIRVTSSKRKANKNSVVLSEKLAITICGWLIAAIAIPLLAVIQALTAVVWGTVTVFQLLNGKGLFNAGDEL
jgi:hypothetical protein